jgi:hypothetical protein
VLAPALALALAPALASFAALVLSGCSQPGSRVLARKELAQQAVLALVALVQPAERIVDP